MRARSALIVLIVMLAGPFLALAHAAAPAGRFDPQVDFVTDTVTKLKWQRIIEVTPLDFASATSFCAAASFGGMTTGWRLPTAPELLTVIDFEAPAATRALDVAAFFNGNHNGYLWSSTRSVQGGRMIVALDVSNQQVVRYGADVDPLDVLCVHE